MDGVRIGNDEVSVEVSSLGAEMQALRTSDGQSWLWHGDPAFWSGRSPILFPIVGRAPEDQLGIAGENYAMGQHGFARRSLFSLAARGIDFCRFELRASAASRAAYPFDFLLAVEHRVVGRGVMVSAELRNLDSRSMPFGIGFHPAFCWPLPGCAGAVHEVRLDNGAEPLLMRLQGGLLRPEALASPFAQGALRLDPGLFAADAMIFPEGAGSGLRYGAGGKAVRLTWKNLPNLAIWSKPGAPFVCLEPWHGMAARLGEGNGIEARPFTIVLAPGAVSRHGFTATLIG